MKSLWVFLKYGTNVNSSMRRIRPSDVCSSFWSRFKKKVLENEDKKISKESFESKIWEIEIEVICDVSKKTTTTAYSI